MTQSVATSSAKPPATAPFGSVQPVDPQQLEKTIEQMYFQGKSVSPEQKVIFRHAINRTGLDPLVGQIRPVIRNGNMAIQTSIDGYRLIADRTGMYAGSDDPIYEESDSTPPFEHPAKAIVTVWKFVQGQRCGFTASARWSEYFPKMESQQFMWRKMPYLMLAKCAEALALRKAFPADLSGVYTDDEMQQAPEPQEAEAKVIDLPHATKDTPLPPDSRTVMEVLTEQKTVGNLQFAYDKAFTVRVWAPDEAKSINDCFLNCHARIAGLFVHGDTLRDKGGDTVSEISTDEKTGKVTINRLSM